MGVGAAIPLHFRFLWSPHLRHDALLHAPGRRLSLGGNRIHLVHEHDAGCVLDRRSEQLSDLVYNVYQYRQYTNKCGLPMTDMKLKTTAARSRSSAV